MKNKLSLLVFSSLLLAGCQGETSSSTSINNHSSSSSKVSSPVVVDSSIGEEEVKEYLMSAATNLLLMNESFELKVEAMEEEITANVYYSISENVYQIQYLNATLTYSDDNLYIDNTLNHYYYPIGYVDSAYLLALVALVDEVDTSLFVANKKGTEITLTCVDGDNTYTIYLEESLMVSLNKVVISNSDSTLTLTPRGSEIKYKDISTYNHINLQEKLSFLEPYLEYMQKENLDFTLSVGYKSLKLNGTLEKRGESLIGEYTYKYLLTEYKLGYDNGVYYFNDVEVSEDEAIDNVMNNLDSSLVNDLIIYLYQVANSELIIEDNLIQFRGLLFYENICFSMDDKVTITSDYFNAKLEVQEVIVSE